MATDIAQIGFKADTSDLDKAKAKLESLAPAATKAQGASTRYTQAINGLNKAAQTLTNAVNGLNNNIVRLIGNSQKEATAVGQAATASNKKAAAANAAATATDKQAAASLRAAAAAKKQAAAQVAAGGAGSGSGSGGGRNNVVPLRPAGSGSSPINTANIAAQFQDIGVTAAMGMSPLQIALQQGTQLSAVLNTMEKPLKGIAVAFRSIINPVSLLTIGIIALVAAGLQFVNWTKVAQVLLNGLADAIEVVTPYVIGLAAVLALVYSPTIIAGIASIIWGFMTMATAATAAGIRIAAAWIVAGGPIVWFLAGLAAITAAVLTFRDELTQVLGFDIVKVAKDSINFIIGAFVGGYNGIKEVWSSLPKVVGDIVVSTANFVIKTIEGMVNGSIEAINALIDAMPDWAKPEGQAIEWQLNLGRIDNEFAGAAKQAGDTLGKELSAAVNKDYVGALGDAIDGATSKVANSLRKFSNGLGKDADGKKKGGKTDGEKFEDIVAGAERSIAALEAEKAAIGMTEYEASKLRHTTELLNEARQKGIELTPQQTTQLETLAAGMARLEVQTKKAKEELEFNKEVTKGFFSDFAQGLRNGESLAQSFSNAVGRALDKITDKLLNEVLDAIFEVNDGFGSMGSGAGGGGGILNSIGSWIGSFFKDGGAFDGGIQKFAKGGAFSNSIVTKPTLFKFAKGTGMMGEAGAEAIMPLKRGSDGSLGVQMYDQKSKGNSSNEPIVNVIINNNGGNSRVSTTSNKTPSGLDIEVSLDEMIANKISTPGTQANQAVKNMQQRTYARR